MPQSQMRSHGKCGKVVHRLCSKCISSIQELNKDYEDSRPQGEYAFQP